LDLYESLIEKLIGKKKAYISKEKPIKEGDRDEVIRFRNPNEDIIFNDLIHGEIKVNTADLGDFVIAKALDEPVFHFANVVDDNAMGITHVIRGEEHLSNTPRQILLHEALGFKIPNYAHIPLVLAADKSKLSKRQGSVALREFLENGYLPEAIINYLALLGWHPIDNQEIFSLDELINIFDLKRVQKGGAMWNNDKLNWVNRQHIIKLGLEEFSARLKKYLPEWLTENNPSLNKIITLLKDKISVFNEVNVIFGNGGELEFIKSAPEYNADLLFWKKNPDKTVSLRHLLKIKELLSEIPESKFSAKEIKTAIWSYANAEGKGDVLWPARVALTGREKSPDPFVSAYILGKEESLKRIDKACGLLNAN
jgi:glutamyl-tRNA synthetase